MVAIIFDNCHHHHTGPNNCRRQDHHDGCNGSELVGTGAWRQSGAEGPSLFYSGSSEQDN